MAPWLNTRLKRKHNEINAEETSIADLSSSGDTEQYGIKRIDEPTGFDPVIDIVLVHGLTGNRHDTWYHKESHTFWPRDLLPKDIKNARVLTFGYDANIANFWRQASQNTIGDHASDLIGALLHYREQSDSTTRPIIFVAHSLGGLVVQEALNRSATSSEPQEREIEQYTTGLVFMGTPHHGSDLAAWGVLFGKLSSVVKGTNERLLAVLKPRSEVLAGIQRGFNIRLRMRNDSIKVVCFFESRRVSGVGKIVEDHSAKLAGYANYSINDDHMGMTKYHNASDSGYLKLLGECRRWTKAVTTKPSGAGISDELAECLRSLHLPGLNDRSNEVAPAFSDSFQWIFTGYKPQVNDWLQHGGGNYWITGKPGSGKSTLMKALTATKLIPEGISNSKPIIATYFFDFKPKAIKESTSTVLRSFLWQILKQSPSYSSIVLPTFQEKERVEQTLVWTESELLRLLHHILLAQDDNIFYILVDALDEYQGEDETIAEFFVSLSKVAPQRSRLCLSSRPYPDFLYNFKSCNSAIVDEESTADIQRYTHTRLMAMDGLDDWQHTELAELITQKAQGVFLWVKLVLDKLCHGHKRLEDFQRLKTRVDELPEGLRAIYQRILDDMDPEDRKEIIELLCILIAAKRPLTDHELRFTLQGVPEVESCYKRRCVGANCDTKSQASVLLSEKTSERLILLSGGLLERHQFSIEEWIDQKDDKERVATNEEVSEYFNETAHEEGEGLQQERDGESSYEEGEGLREGWDGESSHRERRESEEQWDGESSYEDSERSEEDWDGDSSHSGGLFDDERPLIHATVGLSHETLRTYLTESRNIRAYTTEAAIDRGHKLFLKSACQAFLRLSESAQTYGRKNERLQVAEHPYACRPTKGCLSKQSTKETLSKTEQTDPDLSNSALSEVFLQCFHETHSSVFGYTLSNTFHHVAELDCPLLPILEALSSVPMRGWELRGDVFYCSPLQLAVNEFPDHFVKAFMDLVSSGDQSSSYPDDTSEIFARIKKCQQPGETCSWIDLSSSLMFQGHASCTRLNPALLERLSMKRLDILNSLQALPFGEQDKTIQFITRSLAIPPSASSALEFFYAYNVTLLEAPYFSELVYERLIKCSLTSEDVCLIFEASIHACFERIEHRTERSFAPYYRIMDWLQTTQAYQSTDRSDHWLSGVLILVVELLGAEHQGADHLEAEHQNPEHQNPEHWKPEYWKAVSEEQRASEATRLVIYLLKIGAKVNLVTRARARSHPVLWNIIKYEDYEKGIYSSKMAGGRAILKCRALLPGGEDIRHMSFRANSPQYSSSFTLPRE